MSLKAIVFDFDGVLADTEPLHLKAAQQALADTGLRLDADEYYQRYLGFDDAGMIQALAADQGLNVDERVVADFIDRKSQVMLSLIDSGSVLFPGVPECVRRCGAEFPLAIASGALGQEIELILRRTGLRESFQVIVGAEDTPRSKPAPDPYLRAVELLRATSRTGELAPGDCVAIEDSHWGLESARTAGLRCVAVAHTYPIEAFQGVDLVARTLDEITVDGLRALYR